MCVLLVLLQVAGMFFVLGAQLLALMQVLVYAGAIMVLIVVAIMAAPPGVQRPWADYRAPAWMPSVVVFVLLAELVALVTLSGPGLPALSGPAAASLEREMASLLFERYAVATEAVGLLILAAALAVLLEDPRAKSAARTRAERDRSVHAG